MRIWAPFSSNMSRASPTWMAARPHVRVALKSPQVTSHGNHEVVVIGRGGPVTVAPEDPELFRRAVASLSSVRPRPEIMIAGSLRPRLPCDTNRSNLGMRVFNRSTDCY